MIDFKPHKLGVFVQFTYLILPGWFSDTVFHAQFVWVNFFQFDFSIFRWILLGLIFLIMIIVLFLSSLFSGSSIVVFVKIWLVRILFIILLFISFNLNFYIPLIISLQNCLVMGGNWQVLFLELIQQKLYSLKTIDLIWYFWLLNLNIYDLNRYLRWNLNNFLFRHLFWMIYTIFVHDRYHFFLYLFL